MCLAISHSERPRFSAPSNSRLSFAVFFALRHVHPFIPQQRRKETVSAAQVMEAGRNRARSKTTSSRRLLKFIGNSISCKVFYRRRFVRRLVLPLSLPYLLQSIVSFPVLLFFALSCSVSSLSLSPLAKLSDRSG